MGSCVLDVVFTDVVFTVVSAVFTNFVFAVVSISIGMGLRPEFVAAATKIESILSNISLSSLVASFSLLASKPSICHSISGITMMVATPIKAPHVFFRDSFENNFLISLTGPVSLTSIFLSFSLTGWVF